MKVKQAAPNAGADALVLGFTGRVPGFFGDGGTGLIDAVKRVAPEGKVTTPKTKKGARYEQVTFALETEAEDPAGPLALDIHGHREGDDLVLGDHCAIRCNGMRLLRGDLGPRTCGGPGFGDTLNVLGTEHAVADLVPLQLTLVGQAIQYALDALAAIFPNWRPGELWLKRAEACRDIAVPDAVSASRILQHVTLAGATRRKLDRYSRVGGEEDDTGVTLRFVTNGSSPELKIYAKRVDTLRLEAVCRDRSSFEKLTGPLRAEATAEGAIGLVGDFLGRAAARLDTLDGHVRSALNGNASIASLLRALGPILGRMLGQQRGKGPASPQGQTLAGAVVEALLSGGMFKATGIPANHAIRRDLNGLCAPGGPLVKHPRRAVYYLKPQFARACAAIREPSTT